MEKKEKKEYIGNFGIYIWLVKNKRLLCYAFVWGIPFAASCVLGRRLVHEGTVFGPGGSTEAYVCSFLLFLLQTALLSVPAAALAAVVMCGGQSRRVGKWKHSERTSNSEAENRQGTESVPNEVKKTAEKVVICPQEQRPARQAWFYYAAVIFLCWMPVFLAYYPSVFAYDAEGQLYQVIANDYNTHHPLLHTLFLGVFFRLGGVLGSYSAGMAVHSVVQMLLMAAAFGWALSYLYQKRIPRWVRIFLLVFYGFFPAHSVLALSTTKDVLFSALVLTFTLWLYRMLCDRERPGGRKEQAAFIAVAVLMLLFRNNAVYAFLVSVPVVYAGLGKTEKSAGTKKDDGIWTDTAIRKRYLHMMLFALLLFIAGSAALKAATHAHSGSPREMLSVPLQQMARTRVEAEEQLSPQMRQELDHYISSEWVFAAYHPHLADPVKNRAVIHDNPKGLIETWVKLGVQHPAVYIDAFLDNSLGLWFLWDTSHARVYGIGAESGFGYLSTDNRTMPAGCEVVEHSLLPGLRAFMERIVSDNEYSKLPMVRLLFAPALYWWLLYLYLTAALYRKKYREMLPAVYLAAYYLTLLLSPTVLVRYMYPIMATIPVILPCLMMDAQGDGCENTQ